MTFIKKRLERSKKTRAVQISNREPAARWAAALEKRLLPRFHRHCLDRGLPIYVGAKREAEHLVKRHQPTVLEIAGRRMRGRFGPHKKNGKEYNTELFDDFVATGMLALWEAMLAYRLDSPASLETHVRPRIAGAISDEAKAYYKRGITGETRVDRLAYAYPRYSAEWIVALAKKRKIRCSLADAEIALQRVQEMGSRVHCSTIGDSREPVGDNALDGRWRPGDEFIVAGDYLADRKARREYSYFNKSQLAPKLLHHEGWRTERKYYQWPDYPRCGMSGVVDKLVHDADKRHGDRRTNAAELVKMEINWPPVEPRRATYCIPVNTAATAADSKDWKSDLDKLDAVARAQPLVFDVKDQWGWYRSRKDHSPKIEINQTNAARAA